MFEIERVNCTNLSQLTSAVIPVAAVELLETPVALLELTQTRVASVELTRTLVASGELEQMHLVFAEPVRRIAHIALVD